MRVFSIDLWVCVSCHYYVPYVMPLHCRYSKKLLLSVNFVTGSQEKGTRESTLEYIYMLHNI